MIAERICIFRLSSSTAVSYTHLTFPFLIVFLRGSTLKLLEQILLLCAQVLGNLNGDLDVLVTPSPAIDEGDSLVFEPEGGARLG